MPCLSIGNIRAGGTGKTPLLFSILKWMEQEQYKVGVLSRGYGGDEGRMLEARYPQVELIEDPDRVSALRQFDPQPELLLLDDGFQHLQLCRDVDIVILDATRPFGLCFPAGIFREPKSAIRRASMVVVSRSSLVDETKLESIWNEVDRIRHGLSKLPRIAGDVFLSGFHHIKTGVPTTLESIKNKPAMVACGIGNPQSFVELCQAQGIFIKAKRFLKDHSPWSDADINACGDHDLVLVTEKDSVKLKDRALDSMVSVEVDWQFTHGEQDCLEALEAFVLPVRAGKIEPLWQAHQENSHKDG